MKIYGQISVLLLSVLTAVMTQANIAYVCLNGDSERHIRVLYSYTEQKVPCEVVYEKTSGSQKLWDAQNEEGYCEAKALELVEKQRNWGWDCAEMNAGSGSSNSEATTTATPATTSATTQPETTPATTSYETTSPETTSPESTTSETITPEPNQATGAPTQY
jgi:hypothetical protein